MGAARAGRIPACGDHRDRPPHPSACVAGPAGRTGQAPP